MEESHLLEITLISAQGLKPPSANLRRMQTYAVAWVDPSAKLRTQIDQIGGENPTWNEKFLFRVTSAFLSAETSAVSVEIYAVGCLKDPLVGTVRFLIGTSIAAVKKQQIGTPACAAVQIRRPSGRFHGVLNLAAAVVDDVDLPAGVGDLPAICFRDLVGENRRRRRERRRRGSEKSDQSSGGESFDLSSVDLSDGADSTTSTSSSTTSTALKEINNCERFDLAGKRSLRLDGGRLLCGMLQRRGIIPLCPSDEKVFATCQKENL